jgi:tRNA 2-thiouridine synthesizing protein E
MAIELEGKSYETDEEGYLVNLSDWNDQLANEMAKADGAVLDENHWEVITFLRDYYEESGQGQGHQQVSLRTVSLWPGQTGL